MITFLKAEEQHQHKNGGGWVANTAVVADSVYVGPNARVYGDAQVYGYAQVYGNAWETSPLCIQGTKHAITNSSYGHLTIGCKTLTFAEWEKQYEDIGKKNGYTPEQIKEYGAHIKLAIAVGK
jgi:hypothetical protein